MSPPRSTPTTRASCAGSPLQPRRREPWRRPRAPAQLAALKAATLVECEFCIDIGSEYARRSGLTDAQLLALHDPEPSGLFSADELLVIAFAQAIRPHRPGRRPTARLSPASATAASSSSPTSSPGRTSAPAPAPRASAPAASPRPGVRAGGECGRRPRRRPDRAAQTTKGRVGCAALLVLLVSGRPDSNRGPRRPERRALPGCATPRGRVQSTGVPATAL